MVVRGRWGRLLLVLVWCTAQGLRLVDQRINLSYRLTRSHQPSPCPGS